MVYTEHLEPIFRLKISSFQKRLTMIDFLTLFCFKIDYNWHVLCDKIISVTMV